jgi:hypothetical protein
MLKLAGTPRTGGRGAWAMIERHVVYQAVRRIEKRAAVPLIGACLYEAVALTFRDHRTPPITRLAHNHKVAASVVGTLLVLHIWFYEPPDV